MSKGIWVGVGGTARKVTNIYVGVNNVARKVKAGWIGVNGVARQFYSGDNKVTATAFKTVRKEYDGTYYSVTERDESSGVRIGAESSGSTYRYFGVIKLPAIGTDWTKATLYVKRAKAGTYAVASTIDIASWKSTSSWPSAFGAGPTWSVSTALQNVTLDAYSGEYQGIDISSAYKAKFAANEAGGEIWLVVRHATDTIYLDKAAMPYIVIE